jgi:adenylate cyclase
MQGIEIERKFLVPNVPFGGETTGTSMVQGYLASQSGVSVRIRITPDGSYLTAKGPRHGAARLEHECEIEETMAELLLLSCGERIVSKIRYPVLANGRLWVIDVFQDKNEGLVLAEIELSQVSDVFTPPEWCGDEVTEDDRYYNEHLASHPFSEWSV